MHCLCVAKATKSSYILPKPRILPLYTIPSKSLANTLYLFLNTDMIVCTFEKFISYFSETFIHVKNDRIPSKICDGSFIFSFDNFCHQSYHDVCLVFDPLWEIFSIVILWSFEDTLYKGGTVVGIFKIIYGHKMCFIRL